MRPYKEITLNTGETKKVPWDENKSRAKFSEMRAKNIAALRERDRKVCRETGYDYLIREDGLIRLTRVVDGKLVQIFKPGLNPETEEDDLPKSQKLKDFWGKRASIAHSGRETTAMQVEEWAAFCSKPRDDVFVVVPIRHKTKYLRDGKPKPFASQVEVSEVEDEGASTREAFLSDKPKRGRGRPPGSKTKVRVDDG